MQPKNEISEHEVHFFFSIYTSSIKQEHHMYRNLYISTLEMKKKKTVEIEIIKNNYNRLFL